MSNINQLAQAAIPVYNAQVPGEGPKAIPLRLDFGANDVYFLDAKELTDRDFISMFQTIFVDTTGQAATLTIDIAGSNQRITVIADTQGYYPIVCPNPAQFTFTCTAGGEVAIVILLNMPIAPGQWSVV